jgi:hypothetical protein
MTNRSWFLVAASLACTANAWSAVSTAPPHPVVYLHYDYMAGYAPEPRAIGIVVAAFRRQGITLYIDPVHNAIPPHEVVTLHAWDSGYADAACAGADAVAIGDLRARYLHQPAAHTWHYAVFARRAICPDAEHCARCPADLLSGGLPDAGSTGAAELMGSSFVVAAANLESPRRIAQEAAAFMHGLGHNFGLHHGGDDAVNLKPNYLSVMNGAYQSMGIPVARRTGSNEPRACRADADCGWRAHCLEGGFCARIDYSAEKLAALYEGALDKLAGVGGRPGDTDIVFHFVAAGEEHLASVAGPIDWNGDARFGAGVVDADINNDGYQEVISGFDDWAAVRAYLATEEYAKAGGRAGAAIIHCARPR